MKKDNFCGAWCPFKSGNRFTSLSLESDPVESFEYITNTSDITYSGSGINAKFKIIVKNSILTYIYALDGYNYEINDYININVYNNSVFKAYSPSFRIR